MGVAIAMDDWFRNTEWTKDIEEYFEAKLARARNKKQYLRIQASIIAEHDPHVAIHLLERYFGLGNDFAHAQAHCDYATACLALGEIEKGLEHYRLA